MKPSIPASRVWKPEEMNAAFADAYNSGDIDQVLALYEPNSIHVHSNGSLEIGIHSFRHTLEELLPLQGKMVSTNLYCIPFENIAICVPISSCIPWTRKANLWCRKVIPPRS